MEETKVIQDVLNVKTINIVNHEGKEVGVISSFGEDGVGLWFGEGDRNHACLYFSKSNGPVIGIRDDNSKGKQSYAVDLCLTKDGIQVTNSDNSEVVFISREQLIELAKNGNK